jgi:ABC-2 type transport system permease protein
MINNALTIAWKEWQVLFRDRGQMATLFLMPIMFAAVIGTAFSGGTPGIEVFLVNLDSGPHGAFVNDILFDIEALNITELETVDEADRQVADGDALAAIVIPPDFSQKIDEFERTRVQVIVDPTQQEYGSIITGIMSEVLTPVILQGEIQYGVRSLLGESAAATESDAAARRMVEAQTVGIIMTRLSEAFEKPHIAVESVDLQGVTSESLQALDSGYSYSVPSYAVMFAFFIVGTIAGTIFAEKEAGTFRRLMASPIHRGAIIAGKMLAYTLVVGLQIAVVLGVGSGFFHIPLGDAPAGLVLLTAALALSATALGMLVSALARKRSQLEMVSMVIGLVLAAVGGSLVPIPKGGFLELLSQFTPHAHAIKGYLKLTSYGATTVDVLPQIGLLAGVGLLFFLIAVWRFRFE